VDEDGHVMWIDGVLGNCGGDCSSGAPNLGHAP
jgi:hypothetical protein